MSRIYSAQCVCIRTGNGAEGCGVCNETGTIETTDLSRLTHEELAAEILGLERDAGRWRYLRSRSISEIVRGEVPFVCRFPARGARTIDNARIVTLEDADDAVDQAIATDDGWSRSFLEMAARKGPEE